MAHRSLPKKYSCSLSVVFAQLHQRAQQQQQQQQILTSSSLVSLRRRWYFTNGKETKRRDPYEILGLNWGDGATTADIKLAFRTKARELHPDVNKTDTAEQAIKKFQQLQRAYESLIKKTTTGIFNDDDEMLDIEQWKVAIWRQSDRIAMDRTDVAGVKRKRPAPPAMSDKSHYSRQLGHPDGRGQQYGGTSGTSGEYLQQGNTSTNHDIHGHDDGQGINSTTTTNGKQSSTVGNGRNKWVKPKEYTQTWDPNRTNKS